MQTPSETDPWWSTEGYISEEQSAGKKSTRFMMRMGIYPQ